MHPFTLAALLALAFSIEPTLSAADWPQFRGPDRSDKSSETGLLKFWSSGGPKQVWLIKNAGLGYSGISVVKGRVFTMGARTDSDSQREYLIALDEKDGHELWATPIGGLYVNNWGDGPRGTPTVDGDRVYALGGQGDLICAEAATGKPVWKATMKSLGGKVPGWGYCASVLVDGDKLICTPGGGQGAMAALNKSTGAVVWQAKAFVDDAHYSSIITANINGQHQLIQLTPKFITGVNAKDGQVLWQSDWQGRTAVIPTPIQRDGQVYVTSGYGAGCKAVKVGAGNEVADVFANKVMKNHHGGVVLVGDHLYGYSDGSGWVCQDFKTGVEVWSSKAFGKGAVTYADGMLYCLEEESGTVALVEASPKGWSEKGRFTLAPQTTLRKRDGRIWTHPVVSNGKLFLRDQELIFCFAVR
ncbi:MAG: PQQ-like beta-propeller repeat protein [Verrucomicrobia bacterium]|nr:PQQ-like beta-propeller repeat protein [Verrucomicrobiota bacterium]MBI3867637.1 PQQ-like beta-propeller repeat protein [Verrucomicrobiota bacterium]